MDISRHDHHEGDDHRAGGADHQSSRVPAVAGVVLTILVALAVMLAIGLWVL